MKRQSKIFIALIWELAEFMSWFCFCFPGQIGQLLRVLWAVIALESFGRGARLGRGCSVRGPKSISIGEFVSFDIFCFLDAIGGSIEIGASTKFNRNVNLNASVSGRIIIGRDCLVGPNVVMRTAGHVFSDAKSPINSQGHVAHDIRIGDDVWLGTNAVILPGVEIGDGCVVGAGAVVTKSFDPGLILAGVPARVIGNRE